MIKMKKLFAIISAILAILLIYFMFQVSYTVKYNEGNRLYNEGSYSEAKEKYLEALKLNPKKEHECKIRINLALSILKDIQIGDNDYTKLEGLNSARRSAYRK